MAFKDFVEILVLIALIALSVLALWVVTKLKISDFINRI